MASPFIPTSPFIATTYYFELEWVLMWFPIREHDDLAGPVTRNGTIQNTNTKFDPGIGSGQSDIHFLGDVEGLPPTRVASGQVTVFADIEHNLSATFEIRLGAEVRRGKLDGPPGSRIPFMFNIPEGREQRSEGTALSLWGTIVTSSRLGPAPRHLSQAGGP